MGARPMPDDRAARRARRPPPAAASDASDGADPVAPAIPRLSRGRRPVVTARTRPPRRASPPCRGRRRRPAARGLGAGGPVPRPLPQRREGRRAPAQRPCLGGPEVARERWIEVERLADKAAAAGARSACAPPRRASTSTSSTSTSSWRRWRPTSTTASSATTATSTTTSPAAVPASGWRSDLAASPRRATASRRARRAGGRLVASGLLDVEEPDRPFLTRPLRVADRVTAHVLGSDVPDAVLEPVLVEAAPTDEPVSAAMARAVADAAALVYVHDRESAAVHLAVDARLRSRRAGRRHRPHRVSTPADVDHVVAAAVREALPRRWPPRRRTDRRARRDACRRDPHVGRLAGAAGAVRRPRLGPGAGPAVRRTSSSRRGSRRRAAPGCGRPPSTDRGSSTSSATVGQYRLGAGQIRRGARRRSSPPG